MPARRVKSAAVLGACSGIYATFLIARTEL